MKTVLFGKTAKYHTAPIEGVLIKQKKNLSEAID